ncbi:MAG: SsrA-binding protein SmpB [Rubricoccaceae bacterium]|nr:SsrA-binding protein SmpB [Rubricoccaceae bacterium]
MSESPGIKIVATNRKARHEYHLEKPIEAGIVLVGSEVKSLRQGKVSFQDAYVHVGPEGFELLNVHIAPYDMGGYSNHEPTRPRRLLLHRSEMEKLKKGVEQKGNTIIPLKVYFKNGKAKLEIALGRGKKLHDKRQTIAERDEKRRLDRIMKQH